MNMLPALFSSIGIPMGFAFPAALAALILLPAIWWLLKLTPPQPIREYFPPLRILATLQDTQSTPARSPWWLTLIRLVMATLIIMAFADPIWNPARSIVQQQGNLVMVVNNGWISGHDWDQRLQTGSTILEDAIRNNQNIVLIPTHQNAPTELEITSADRALARLKGLLPQPTQLKNSNLNEQLAQAIKKYQPKNWIYLSDGLQSVESEQIKHQFQRALDQDTDNEIQMTWLTPDQTHLAYIKDVNNLPAAMKGTIQRLNTQTREPTEIIAYDAKSLIIARQSLVFEEGKASTPFEFKMPVELRNQIARLELEQQKHAGAVHLLDENNKRRLIGLISGAKHDQSQPLLSPLYYISRALAPYSDIRRAESANIALAAPELINQGVSAIFLADVGVIPQESAAQLQQWVEQGGLLVRFSGPRLASSPDAPLLPVDIRKGDRNIGGALSWDQPKHLAPFAPESPFYGLPAPKDISVSRQVLALQKPGLEKKVWARLEDGTPLVTAEQQKQGWLILFHVNSDTLWSNLPLSGTFVDMLRRVVSLSSSNSIAQTSDSEQTLPPYRLLDGLGRLSTPGPEARPIIISKQSMPVASLETHPGIYGTIDGQVALNLVNVQFTPEPFQIDQLPQEVQLSSLEGTKPTSLVGLALAIALGLFLIDCMAVLWMAGILNPLKWLPSTKPAPIASFIFAIVMTTLFLSAFLMVPNLAWAQATSASEPKIHLPENFDFSPSLETKFAYVITGIDEVDKISAAGLRGLSAYVGSRTSIEPTDPVGLDIAKDPLVFYPFLYWPIHRAAPLPSAATMARIDNYMKNGGTVLFDTRDQISGLRGGTANSPEARYLQTILANLDVPALEPVPTDHVLTKSFYLLQQFPGRYTGSELWVELSEPKTADQNRPVRRGDGVSTIIITGNDFAGAWAVDKNLAPLLPIIPSSPRQRELAFRVGVNLVMYTMTGNYKSDQVHIPALLERLGQ